jgi:hypothetical protein
VASKPFNTSYKIKTPQGHIVLNGDQITKIEANRPPVNPFGAPVENSWVIVFHLSDGSKHSIEPSDWTREFAKEIFEDIE